MKKFKNYIILVFAAITCCNSISSQETHKVKDIELRKFGIGFNLEQNISYSSYYIQPFSNQLIFTFNICDKIRIEPDLGFHRIESHNDDNDRTNTESQIDVGIGGYGLLLRSPVCFYYGMKLGYLTYLQNSEYTTTSTTAGKGVKIGPVMGLDYFISSHFSIGAEFKLLYAAELRKYVQDVDANITSEVRYKNLSTIAGLKFRFYF